MNESDRLLLSRIVVEDGPLLVLVYKSIAAGLDEQDRYVAQCLQYGQLIASGREELTAMKRLVNHIMAYLRHCDEIQLSSQNRRSWASKEALAAFLMADRITLPKEIAAFFKLKANTEFQDPELQAMPIIDVRTLLTTQPGESLEDYVDAKCA